MKKCLGLLLTYTLHHLTNSWIHFRKNGQFQTIQQQFINNIKYLPISVGPHAHA